MPRSIIGIRVEVKKKTHVNLVKFSAKVYLRKQNGQIFAPKTFPTFTLLPIWLYTCTCGFKGFYGISDCL